jgi:hypothetical protein
MVQPAGWNGRIARTQRGEAGSGRRTITEAKRHSSRESAYAIGSASVEGCARWRFSNGQESMFGSNPRSTASNPSPALSGSDGVRSPLVADSSDQSLLDRVVTRNHAHSAIEWGREQDLRIEGARCRLTRRQKEAAALESPTTRWSPEQIRCAMASGEWQAAGGSRISR